MVLRAEIANKDVVPGEDPLAGARRRVAELYGELGLAAELAGPKPEIPTEAPQAVQNGL
jgi:hypothetical protein